MFRSAVLVLLVGCSGTPRSDVTTAPTKPVASDRLPDGPPLVTPGEHMSYRLALGGMELATYDFGIGEVTDVAGKRAIVVQSHAKAVGLVKMVANIDDFFTSWIDVSTGRPLRWTTDEYATKGTDKERTDVRFYERKDNVLPVDFHLNDQPAKPEPQKVSMPDVWDYNAFLVALRVWDGPPGTTVSAEVLRSRFMWHVDMKIRGKEKVVTALNNGEQLEALRLDGHTYKVDRNGVKAPDSDERDFSVWISTDDGRVPLQTVARTDYGDIKMEITDYDPGNGQRLRN